MIQKEESIVFLEADSLSKCYHSKVKKPIYAVNQVSFSIRQGETLGLVGESGCGKSTLGKLLLNLEQPSDGQVRFCGEEISSYSFRRMRPIRKDMQMVFQNSAHSFNPYLTVKQIIQEPLDNFGRYTKEEKHQKVVEILDKVGLDESYQFRYSGELSGGQRQRVGIARAFVLNPKFVVCDEAVSALDYAVRNKILNLLTDLKEEQQSTYLFISHDLSAVRQVCDRVIVMYMGQIMEILPSLDEGQFHHPYTKALLAAALSPNPRNRNEKKVLFRECEDDMPPKEGCMFQNRCLYVEEKCRKEKPPLFSSSSKDGTYCVACHFCKQKIKDI